MANCGVSLRHRRLTEKTAKPAAAIRANRRLYFYYDSGHWRVSVSLPSGIRIEVEDYVTLEMETDRPYEYHAEVAKRYPPGQQKKMYKGNGKKKKW